MSIPIARLGATGAKRGLPRVGCQALCRGKGRQPAATLVDKPDPFAKRNTVLTKAEIDSRAGRVLPEKRTTIHPNPVAAAAAGFVIGGV